MSEDSKGTTVFLDPDATAEADAIAVKLGPLVGGKMSRSAVVRRAVHELFITLGLVDEPERQVA